MEFRNLTAGQIRNHFAGGADLRRFYESYLPWLQEQDRTLHGFLALTETTVWKTIEWLEHQPPHLPLWGVPIAIKDCIVVRGERATAASRMLESFVAPYDATVIERLRAAGAVIVGKTNLDQFAMGSSTENSAFGSTRNPHDHERVPGGSSGGSAAAVGGGLVPLALGSDTGGSIRQPAGFCGVYGLKPTYGAVSRYGLMAMASSLDQIGPFARTVDDLEFIYGAIRGYDPRDNTSQTLSTTDHRLPTTIGLPKEFFEGLDDRIKQATLTAIERTGLKLKTISLPSLPHALACYYLTVFAEVSANMARYDGIRFGLSRRDGDNFWDIYLRSRESGLGREVKRRVLLGTFVLSHGYYDAYYGSAQRLRRILTNDFRRALTEVDVIAAPISPILPFRFGEKLDEPLAMYLADIYTVPINLATIPALTVPIGTLDNLPLGLQLIGNRFEEGRLFELARKF